jgi:hypothetical protein
MVAITAEAAALLEREQTGLGVRLTRIESDFLEQTISDDHWVSDFVAKLVLPGSAHPDRPGKRPQIESELRPLSDDRICAGEPARLEEPDSPQIVPSRLFLSPAGDFLLT